MQEMQNMSNMQGMKNLVTQNHMQGMQNMHLSMPMNANSGHIICSNVMDNNSNDMSISINEFKRKESLNP
jgi:hypothetical protein